VATEAAWLNGKDRTQKTLTGKEKTDLTLTGLLMEGLGSKAGAKARGCEDKLTEVAENVLAIRLIWRGCAMAQLKEK
jgi:hypothetical protein